MSSSAKTNLKLDWCSHAAAKYACERWHYSGSMPMPPIVKIGVWERGEFIGAVLFSRGASPGLLNPYGLESVDGCEMSRVALRQHDTHVSRIVKVSMALLRDSNKGIRLIVSFADPAQGHNGAIYQAGNWIYTGQSKPENQFLINGRWVHRREAVGKTSFGKHVVGHDWKRAHARLTPGKHRYIYPLDKEMRERIIPLAKPYPKRAGGVVSDASNIRLEEGGAIPTPALQVR